jgi:S-adenosylmethionine:diacylglycerol 3-amino-3-carboxypropyl transferase
VNEDNNIEREIAFRNKPSTIFCITGSGERLISLLDSPGLEKIVAVDINPEAQFLLELKLITLEKLEIEEYFDFIGYYDTPDHRLEIFSRLTQYLTPDSLKFWQENLSEIKKGILNIGHFENYIRKLRPITRLFLGNGFFDCFRYDLNDCRNFPFGRWKFFLMILSTRYFFYITRNKDIAFNSSDCERKIISKGLERTLKSNHVTQSFMFNLLFKGHLREMDESFVPPSLQPEILSRIKKRLINKEIEIIYLAKDISDAIKENPDYITDNTFLSFSDILSFEKPEYLIEIISILKKMNRKNLNGVFRSFLRNEFNSAKFPENLFNKLIDYTDKEMTNMYKAHYFKL